MPAGPPGADRTQGHDAAGILARVTGQVHGRTGSPQRGGRYGLLLVFFADNQPANTQTFQYFSFTTLTANYLRMLTARETTRIATSSEITSSAIIMSLAHCLMAETSVGLNAIAVANEKWK